MKIKVKDLSKGVEKVPVRIPKAIWNMSDEEIIKATDLKNQILEYHYSVEQEYHKVDDIYSEGLEEYVSELLYEYAQEPEFEGYDKIASRLVAKLEDELIEEIYERDDDASETYREIEEARKGQY